MTIAPVLLISPDGMLGRAWQELLTARGIAFEGVSYPSFDLRDRAQVEEALAPRFATVINCAAFTDVDGAETREAEATAINGDGVGLLAARCKQIGALLVHYGTDYVFDGAGTAPYPVDAPLDPKNAYGRSKAVGEQQLMAAGCKFLLARTSWLYAPWGKNFVETMAKLCREKPVMRVVNDQRGRPTSAQYLAERTLALLEAGAEGVFHVTDGGECTWFEFACEIAARTGGTARIEPCTSAEFVRPATRPAYSVLDLSKTDALVGASRPWQENLADVVRARG